jgi:hypothetical protein
MYKINFIELTELGMASEWSSGTACIESGFCPVQFQKKIPFCQNKYWISADGNLCILVLLDLTKKTPQFKFLKLNDAIKTSSTSKLLEGNCIDFTVYAEPWPAPPSGT